MAEPIFMKLGMYVYINAPEPISTVYFINLSPTAARQGLGKNVTAATNTHATIEELLDASFFMRSVSYQRKVGD
jgi:hypothetical protein